MSSDVTKLHNKLLDIVCPKSLFFFSIGDDWRLEHFIGLLSTLQSVFLDGRYDEG